MRAIIISIILGVIIGFGTSTISLYVTNKHNEEIKRIDAVIAQINKCTDFNKIENEIIKKSPNGVQKVFKKKIVPNIEL